MNTSAPMKTCLLVIDAQASFTARPYFDSAGLAAYLQAQNALIAGAAAQGADIVRVFHHDPAGTASDAFCSASGLVRPIDGLRPFEPALTVHKTRHSALVGTGLDVWLISRGVQQLIISGIRTEQCCETTARHASDLGWQVLFVPEATLTWDMPRADGGLLRAADIRAHTGEVLRHRFAAVLGVQEALARIG